MPYFVCVGSQGVAGQNAGGAGSRGYWIFRRGTEVTIRYGPVTRLIRGRLVRFGWVWRREIEKKLASAREADAFLRRKVAEKLMRGYTALRSGVKIHDLS